MSFWSLPDEEKTADNVDDFLNRQIPRLAMQAGVSLTSLSSPQLTSAPAHGSSLNNTENKLQKGLNAIEVLQGIRYTMNQTHGIYSELLIQYYFQNKPVWEIRNNLLINHDAFPKFKRDALCRFAECWQNTQDKYDWDERIDLRIF